MLFSKPGSVEWLVVFLGNPGPKYEMTRHNAGFLTADAVEKKYGVRIDRARFKALTATATVGGAKVLFMKPQTHMNSSGEAVGEAMRFYKVPTEHILVISDDVTLSLGRLRVRRSGSAGGHNGLKSIIAHCGGEGFPRIRIGVGAPPNPEYDRIDWVLSAFKNQDAEDILKAAARAADAVGVLIEKGVDEAMNEYNMEAGQ